MKKLMLAGVMAMLGSAAFGADAIEGTWQTEVDDGAYGHIVIAPCGPAFCGKIGASFKEDGTEYDSGNKGKMIVIDMVPAGDGTYEGSVYRPSNDKTYVGNIVVSGDNLKLAGCVLGGLICAKQSWTRVK